jgi:hypothetical protein
MLADNTGSNQQMKEMMFQGILTDYTDHEKSLTVFIPARQITISFTPSHA